MTLTTTGRIKKIFPTMTRKGKDGAVVMIRKFWVDAPGQDFGSGNVYQTVEMNIINREGKINPNFAATDDLDRLEPGRVIRFMFQIVPVLSVDKRSGEERCFTNLVVCSRIELMGSSTPYAKAKQKDFERKQEERKKILEEAMKDYSDGNVR